MQTVVYLGKVRHVLFFLTFSWEFAGGHSEENVRVVRCRLSGLTHTRCSVTGRLCTLGLSLTGPQRKSEQRNEPCGAAFHPSLCTSTPHCAVGE